MPISISKYDDDEDKEKEESRPKITKKARTPKAQKQSSKTSLKMTVSSEEDTEEEKEETEDKKLVQPSKILIPQDGQQPKKWRLADQRR